ncbi:MAG: hypothetical protein HY787_03130 [Deltaproteobacteria bacterium]|nr:hypothetical protein [Deltaproteobacteria bacterium]
MDVLNSTKNLPRRLTQHLGEADIKYLLYPGPGKPLILLPASENRLYTKRGKAASLMPRGSHALVEEAGHLIPRERPEEVTAVIMNFLSEVPN